MRNTKFYIPAAILLGLLLILAFFLPQRGTLRLTYAIPPEAEGVAITVSDEGLLSAETERENGEQLMLFLRAKRSGSADLTVAWSGIDSDSMYSSTIQSRITVLPGGIVRDSLTGNFTSWEHCFLIISLLLLVLAAILLLSAGREERRDPFSYRPALRYGLGMFFTAVGLLRLGYAVSALRDPGSNTVWGMLIGYAVSAQSFLKWTAPAVAAFAGWLFVSNTVLLRKEGKSLTNLLGILAACMALAGASLGIGMAYIRVLWGWWNAACNLYAGIFVYMECQLAAVTLCALRAGRHCPGKALDYIVILGCRIRPDGTLYPLVRNRADRALAFAREQEKKTGKFPVLIPSGGQGDDEPMPEGAAIADYLCSQRVEEKYLLPETRSLTTRENLLFSGELIDARGGGNAAFCTTGYHVFRSGILARSLERAYEGFGCPTKWYFWPNAFLREFIGLLFETRKRQGAMIGLIAGISIMLSLIM